MALQPTVDSLIDQVRSRLNLATSEGVNDTNDILPALNRAKDYAFDILARRYPEPILTNTTVAITSGTSSYSLPDNTFEDRLLKVDWRDTSGQYQELDRLSYREVQDWESTVASQVPQYYTLIGRTYQLIPTPQSGTARIWYLEEPEDYVKSLGRITALDLANNKFSVNEINSSLTTSTAALGAYLNVVDGKTGAVKYSLQLQTIDEDNLQLTFKTTPSRVSVLGRTIQDDLTSLDITQDDHICAINGTCIPYFKKPISNFCIEYATAEMKDTLQREGLDLAQNVLKKFEEHVERTWVRREVVGRVRKQNSKFHAGYINPQHWRTRS